MRPADLLSYESALNLTGILVLLVVGTFSVVVVYGDPLLVAAVGGLSAAHLLAFLVFISEWKRVTVPHRKVLLWLEAFLIVALYFLIDVSFIAILGIVWVVQSAELYRPRTAVWLLLGAVMVFAVSQFTHLDSINLISAVVSSLTLGLFHVFALSATQRAIRESELREHTAALNRELIATRELLSQSTRQNERLRIARDLHDLLGHHMTALILNLEVAAHISDGRAREKVEQARSLAKLLLSDLRTAVSELREEESIDLEQAVNKLVADIPGIEFSVDFSQAPDINDVEQAETLLRCIQESVTNVMKHSNANRCLISLTGSRDECTLTVTDNGTNAGNVSPGNGLKGMHERVTATGGKLSWQQNLNGFSLQIELPAAG